MLKKLFNSQFFKGSFIYTSVSFSVSILSYVFNLIIARFFPLAAYGEYMTALSYMMVFAVPFGAIAALLIKRIGATSILDRHAFVDVLEKWIFEYLEKYAFYLILGFVIVGGFLYSKANISLSSVVFIISMTLVSLITILYTSSLQAFKKFFLSGGLGALTAILKIIGGVLVLFFIPNLPALYFVMVISGIISFIIVRKVVKNLNGFETRKEALKYTLGNPLEYLKKKSVLIPLFSTLGMVGIINADVMLVKKFFVADEVGLYAGLALLGRIILYASAPLSAVAYAFFTGSESKHNSKKILLLTTLLLLGMGGVALAGYTFFPELVVSVVFGEKFLEVAGLVQLAAVFGVVYSLAYLLSQYFIAQESKLSLLSLVAMVGQIVGIILFHDSFAQVMWVGIAMSGGLVGVYLGRLVWGI